MAVVTHAIGESIEFDQMDDEIIFGKSIISGSVPTEYIRPSYKRDFISETEFNLLKENIAFIIDCYQMMYDKVGAIESRLNEIETQNREILSLLSKEQNVMMASSPEAFTEISAEKMRAIIIEYYKNHSVVYPSDIANEMNFDLRDVVHIVKELIASGEVEEVI